MNLTKTKTAELHFRNSAVLYNSAFIIREGRPQAFPIGEGGPLAVDEV